MSQQLAMELENFLIPDFYKNIPEDFPYHAKKLLNDSIKEGIPSAAGYHEKYGYFILMSGQGPMIAWIQYEEGK